MSEPLSRRYDRRTFVGRGALGVAAGIALGPEAATALAGGAGARVDSPETVTTSAVTAEALANVFLAEGIRRLAGTPLAAHTPVVQAAGAAHWLHYAYLRETVKAMPLTMRFWIPDRLYGKQAAAFFPTLEVVAGIFANAYLIGTTAFAAAARTDRHYDSYARIAGEIACHASEVRATARVVQGDRVPNNRAFAAYPLKTMAAVVAKVESSGVGFGKQGSTPGRYYTFDGHKSPLFSTVTVESPA